MWPVVTHLTAALWFHNGRFTRPLLFLHSYLFKSANAKTSGFNRFVNITDDVSQPAFLKIFAAPLISAFNTVPSDERYNPL